MKFLVCFDLFYLNGFLFKNKNRIKCQYNLSSVKNPFRNNRSKQTTISWFFFLVKFGKTCDEYVHNVSNSALFAMPSPWKIRSWPSWGSDRLFEMFWELFWEAGKHWQERSQKSRKFWWCCWSQGSRDAIILHLEPKSFCRVVHNLKLYNYCQWFDQIWSNFGSRVQE